MRKFISLLMIVIFLLVSAGEIFGCTTVIVSGKFTKDGRPLLWKNRDTKSLNNKLMYFTDGKYSYIALVDSDDDGFKNIWIGFNTEGFAIMNSASYNLNIDDTTSIKDLDGEVMKRALQTCATIDDFEKMLNDLPKPLGVESNFGVIDAKGGAAYFETGNFAYTKLDVNDPSIAPHGYLIHNNYSFTGERDLGHGYIRYFTAEELLFNASGTNSLTTQFILQKVARSLKHSLTNTDYNSHPLKKSDEFNFVHFQDFIPRDITSSSVLIEGVKKNEASNLTTMWTILGFPLCSFTVPIWIIPSKALPKCLTAEYPANAPLCDLALELKEKCFPVKRGHGYLYLNLSALLNSDSTGILQKLIPFEKQIFEETKWRLNEWRKNGLSYTGIQQYYDWIDKVIFPKFKGMFN